MVLIGTRIYSGAVTNEDIAVGAVVFYDAVGRILTVRKTNTRLFMLPGGKIADSESPLDAAVREVAEELGVTLDPAKLTILGSFTAPAANEPGQRVVATVYQYPETPNARPAAEIAEVQWLNPERHAGLIAPLLRDEVFPALACRAPKATS